MTEWWRHHEYLAGRPIGGGLWICLAQMIFTTRLMLCDEWSVYEFYCYPNEDDAWKAFASWDGKSRPFPGWVKYLSPAGEERVGAG
jgi:hypothetical protein